MGIKTREKRNGKHEALIDVRVCVTPDSCLLIESMITLNSSKILFIFQSKSLQMHIQIKLSSFCLKRFSNRIVQEGLGTL